MSCKKALRGHVANVLPEDLAVKQLDPILSEKNCAYDDLKTFILAQAILAWNEKYVALQPLVFGDTKPTGLLAVIGKYARGRSTNSWWRRCSWSNCFMTCTVSCKSRRHRSSPSCWHGWRICAWKAPKIPHNWPDPKKKDKDTIDNLRCALEHLKSQWATKV